MVATARECQTEVTLVLDMKLRERHGPCVCVCLSLHVCVCYSCKRLIGSQPVEAE